MKIKSYTIDLSEQMAVCDANYIRLLKLLGNTRSMNQRIFELPGLGVADKSEKISVSLNVLEEFKYTSTISIRQISSAANQDNFLKYGSAVGTLAKKELRETEEPQLEQLKKINEIVGTEDGSSAAHFSSPEMIIRVYHDAKTAEVTSYQNHKYFKAVYPLPNPYMYQCDEKEQLNLFLAEWLNLCINEGLSNPDELYLEKLTCS
ncbi:DUF1249 domain-containing protein [Gammaproteobacteria bacterium]|nr:DUF1249 domain-containing protein [Gammaproteobacteria bacterium]